MRKRAVWMIGVMMAMAVLGGCGAGGSKYAESSAQEAPAAAYDTAYNTSASYDGGKYEMIEMEEEMAEPMEMEAGSVSDSSGIESVSSISQKLIKTVDMNMETKEFDSLLSGITEKTAELGGYVEFSEVSGGGYYGSGSRNAWLQLRIPADKLDGFVQVVGEMGNVTRKSESVQDVTLEYVDVESHKQALLTEQERLMTLLENAENMEDIIQIETRLSQIRYELQSYESRLRVMDNQVSYSTISLSIYEVERMTEVEKKTFFQEITSRFSDNLYDIGQDMRGFVIWFVSFLPYLVIWAVLIGIVVWIFRRKAFKGIHLPRREKKKNKENEE